MLKNLIRGNTPGIFKTSEVNKSVSLNNNMQIWNKISKVVDFVQLIIVALMLILVALGVYMFFSSATGYESNFTADEFKILLGDVLLILVTVELIKTIIIYVTQGAFYVQGIVSAILVAVCRNIIFIKFEEGVAMATLINAVAAAVLILALIVALKYAPKKLQIPLPRNIKEINILMENVPGALASAAGIMARHNVNIISGQIITTAKGEGNWIGLIEINDRDVENVIIELKKHELIKDVEVISEK